MFAWLRRMESRASSMNIFRNFRFCDKEGRIRLIATGRSIPSRERARPLKISAMPPASILSMT